MLYCPNCYGIWTLGFSFISFKVKHIILRIIRKNMTTNEDYKIKECRLELKNLI